MRSGFVKPKKTEISGGNDRRTLMNDGSQAGRLYGAAERHLPTPVSCFVYSLYFHIFVAATFERNVLEF